MGYFTQTESLENLKEQYRVLLEQFDCKDPKNSRILMDIDNEYKKCQLYVKMAPLRKTKEKYENWVEEAEKEKKKIEFEKQTYYKSIQERIRMKYTEEEIDTLLNIVTNKLIECADSDVKDNVEKKSYYLCRTEIQNFNNFGYRKTYVNIRAQREFAKGSLLSTIEAGDDLEIAIVSFYGEENKESELRKVEEMLGQVYIESYKAACEKYFDNVEYARLIAALNRESKFDKITKPIEKIQLVFLRIIGSVLVGGFFGGATLFVSIAFSDIISINSKLLEFVFGAIIVIISVVVMFFTVKVFNVRFTQFLTPKGISYEKLGKSRITELESNEQFKKDKNVAKGVAGVFRTILRLIGI